MGEDQPLVRFMNIVVWDNLGLIFFRLEPRAGNPDGFGQVASGFFFELAEYRGNATTRIKDIIYNQ